MHPMLLVLTACTPDGAPGADPADSRDVGDPALFDAVTVGLAEVSTVAVVGWSSAEPLRARVVYGEDDLSLATPWETEPTTDHRHVLVGLPAFADARARLVVETPDGDVESDDVAFTTGGVPSVLPTLTADGEDGLDGGWAALSAVADQGGSTGSVVTMVDGKGRWIWAQELGTGEGSVRVRPSRDGTGLLYNVLSMDKDVEVPQSIRKVTWEGELVWEVPAPDQHHDFVELPSGDVVYLGTEPIDLGGGTYLPSDTLVQVTPAGEPTVIWRLWEELDRFGGTDVIGELDEGETLGHANAMQYVEDEDAFFVNFALLHASALLDGDGVRWVLGGDTSDIAYDEREMGLWRAHEARLDGDRLWMFVNEAGGEPCSGAWEVSLDLTAMTAARQWEHRLDPCYYNYVLGGIAPLPSGDILATWSTAGRLDRLDATTHEPTWTLTASAGAGFGYVEPLAAWDASTTP